MNNYQSDPIFWQRFLKCAGFYQATVDGQFGPKSRAAVVAFEAQSKQIARNCGVFDPRSEGNILSLQPRAQEKARWFLAEVTAKLGSRTVEVRIISGTRTYAEQDALYAQGRSQQPGPIVTKARGGQSNHNFGVAWDIGLFEAGKYIPESPLYKKAGEIGRALGLEWGGDWQSLQDGPHFQAIRAVPIASMRNLFEAGLPLMA